MDRDQEEIEEESRRVLRNTQRQRDVDRLQRRRLYSGIDVLLELLAKQDEREKAHGSRSGD